MLCRSRNLQYYRNHQIQHPCKRNLHTAAHRVLRIGVFLPSHNNLQVDIRWHPKAYFSQTPQEAVQKALNLLDPLQFGMLITIPVKAKNNPKINYCFYMLKDHTEAQINANGFIALKEQPPVLWL